MESIVLWLVVTNGVAFFLYGLDKLKATKRVRRISERVLLGIAALGGGLGAFLGMQAFRHKTKHLKFRWGIPFCILLNGITVLLLLFYQT